jgi:ribonuclease HI
MECDGDQHEIIGFLGHTTNNVAEYAGLLAALGWARKQGVEELVLYSDSLLLVNQFSGRYKVKAPHLKPIFLQALKLRRGIRHVEAHHVPRAQNNLADSLANRAVDEHAPLPDWLELELPAQ